MTKFFVPFFLFRWRARFTDWEAAAVAVAEVSVLVLGGIIKLVVVVGNGSQPCRAFQKLELERTPSLSLPLSPLSLWSQSHPNLPLFLYPAENKNKKQMHPSPFSPFHTLSSSLLLFDLGFVALCLARCSDVINSYLDSNLWSVLYLLPFNHSLLKSFFFFFLTEHPLSGSVCGHPMVKG